MMSHLLRRLRDPAFGTETSERNLMEQAAARIEKLEADVREVDGEFSLLSNDLGKALLRIEKLEAALRHYSCTCRDEFDACKARYDMLVCCGWPARAALKESSDG